jgi:hypothetical protein
VCFDSLFENAFAARRDLSGVNAGLPQPIADASGEFKTLF